MTVCKMLGGLCWVCIVGLSTPATAQGALAPNSAWVVDAQENDCVLLRTYGTAAGEQDLQLQIRPQASADGVDLTLLMLDGVKPPRSSVLNTVLTPGGETKVYAAFQAPVQGGRAARFRYNPAATALFRKAETMELRDGEQRLALLKVPGVEKAIAGVRSCMDGLIRSWGYDPVVLGGLSRRTKPLRLPADWGGLDNYPGDAMRAGETVSVDVRIDVSGTGRAVKCAVWRGDKRVDQRAVCSGMLHDGRFEPALDAGGEPVPAFWIGQLMWKTP